MAVDIDGTLGDYHGHFIRFAAGWLGIDYHNERYDQCYDGRKGFGEWFCERFGTDMTTFRSIKLAYRQGGMKRTMPPFKAMIEATIQLSELAEIWLCTTRPYLRLDGIDPDTREWLRRHEVRYDGLLYDEDKYRKLAEYVGTARVVAVVDDLAEQYDAAAEIFGGSVPVLRGTQYNRNIIRTNVATSASNMLKYVRPRVEAWVEAHKLDAAPGNGAVHCAQPVAAAESTN